MGKPSAKTIAMQDQALAVIRDAKTELFTNQVADLIGVSGPVAYRVLRQLENKKLVQGRKDVRYFALLWWYDGVGADA